ncbi:ATP-binding protein [Ancylomarina sp. 16SWW S1-10-2]|uniref:ATP-binding protein n=1 Tax=Ancylomarina sp. 16SWW S1-10-2 TaxID=2499681 RepID=UPI0012AD43B1|nr:ATP-binding protein [Ancylomarina sp. 16SWW S1-10-2]MRT92450.1 response regulator [Ancylomarina sp. 16SWW S1-10-2]
MVKTKDQHIKFKVIAGYLILLIAIVSSGFIGYTSYERLMDSVSQISKPDAEISQMNHLLTDLSEAENHIRVYSLTKKEQYLDLFGEKVKSIKNELDSLRSSKISNRHSIQMIDSMIFLIDVRSQKLNAFATIKKEKEGINYNKQALKELSVASKYSRSELESSLTKRTTVDTIKKIKKKVDEPKSFLGIRFGKKKESKYEVVDRVIERQVVHIDSSFLQKQDSLFKSFREELESSRMKEQANRARLRSEELKLVDENSIILQKIKKLLTEIEQQQIRDINKKVKQTERIAKDSIILIAFVIIIGFIFGVLFILFTLFDLSKSDYLRQQLMIAKAKAEELAKVKEEFLASMSHEIRTPLNALIGFSRQLDKTVLDSDQAKYAKVIGNSSNHLLGIVNDILDLAKIEAGKLVVEKQYFEPKKLIQEVYNLLSESAKKKKIEFSWSYEGEDEYYFESDPFRLKQILLNLGSNAIKFTEEGSVKIKGFLESNGDKNTLKVCLVDTGIGISADKLERVFEDFSQAESFSARKYGGTGLGLSISRRLARMLGGELNVNSELDKGSEFCLDLPINKGEAIVESSVFKSINKVPEELKQKTILVAEDDEYSSLLMQTIFKGWGLKTSFVNNGLKALDCFKKTTYDIVLTDIHMPEMGGVDLCKNIRTSLNLDIPIIALTANVRKVDLDKYIKEGMSAYLLKPFEEDTLLKVLCEQLNLKLEASSMEKELVVSEPNNFLFDLSEIEKFSGGDKALINKVLTSFVRVAKESLELINNACNDSNYTQVGELAHRMLSSYRQLKIESASKILIELEKLIHKEDTEFKNPDKLKKAILELEEISNQVFEQIIDLQKD